MPRRLALFKINVVATITANYIDFFVTTDYPMAAEFYFFIHFHPPVAVALFATATGGRNMTVQELYEYAKQCGVSDYEIRVQYRDDGGEHQGTDAFLYLLAEKGRKGIGFIGG